MDGRIDGWMVVFKLQAGRPLVLIWSGRLVGW